MPLLHDNTDIVSYSQYLLDLTLIADLHRGYQLLAKLGYQEGKGIGRGQQGRSEPLPLVMRTHRAGLGVDEEKVAQKRRQHEQAAAEGTSGGMVPADLMLLLRPCCNSCRG